MDKENWLQIHKSKWWPIETETICGEKHLAGLTISNIGGVFMMICVGIACSCIILLYEYLYFKNKYKQKNRYLNQSINTSMFEIPTEISTNCNITITDTATRKAKSIRKRSKPIILHTFAEIRAE